jgi:hypothetical protein
MRERLENFAVFLKEKRSDSARSRLADMNNTSSELRNIDFEAFAKLDGAGNDVDFFNSEVVSDPLTQSIAISQ